MTLTSLKELLGPIHQIQETGMGVHVLMDCPFCATNIYNQRYAHIWIIGDVYACSSYLETYTLCRKAGKLSDLISATQQKVTAMSNKDKPNFANALNCQDLQERAMQKARAHLKAKGIECPLYDSQLSGDENYERMRNYSEQEASLMVEYLKAPSGPRPLVLDNTSDKEWKGYRE